MGVGEPPLPPGETFDFFVDCQIYDSSNLISYDQLVSFSGDPDPALRGHTTLLADQPVDIPQGATIQSAVINFTFFENEGSGVDHTVTIDMEAADNAEFTNDIGTLLGKPRTAASQVWNATETDNETANFAVVLQEVISRPGWVSGNLVRVFLETSNVAGLLSWGSLGPTFNQFVLRVQYT